MLPQLQLRFDRQSWPDVVLIIDDSRSMGEPDSFTDEKVRERADELGRFVRKKIQEKLPPMMAALDAELATLNGKLSKETDDKARQNLEADIKYRKARYDSWKGQLDRLEQNKWAPSRLQLVQALLAQPDMDWLDYLVNSRRTKLHIYHLDAAGPGHAAGVGPVEHGRRDHRGRPTAARRGSGGRGPARGRGQRKPARHGRPPGHRPVSRRLGHRHHVHRRRHHPR